MIVPAPGRAVCARNGGKPIRAEYYHKLMRGSQIGQVEIGGRNNIRELQRDPAGCIRLKKRAKVRGVFGVGGLWVFQAKFDGF